MDADMRAVMEVVKGCSPILGRYDPAIQGGALADMLAIWLAGHRVAGDETATAALREKLLIDHIAAVRVLIAPNAVLIDKME